MAPSLQFITCKLDIPTAAIIPNITRNMPPMTGSGMVIKTAPNFPNMPRMIIRMPVVWRTSRLPTWKNSAYGKTLTVFCLQTSRTKKVTLIPKVCTRLSTLNWVWMVVCLSVLALQWTGVFVQGVHHLCAEIAKIGSSTPSSLGAGSAVTENDWMDVLVSQRFQSQPSIVQYILCLK